MTLDDLRRSTLAHRRDIAHRRDSRHAQDARIAVIVAMSGSTDPEAVLAKARAYLIFIGGKLALEHLAEIEERARTGKPYLTARENGAAEAARARTLVRR